LIAPIVSPGTTGYASSMRTFLSPTIFLAVTKRLAKIFEGSLMVGRRCDVDITQPWDFLRPEWTQLLRFHGPRARQASAAAMD